MSSTKKFKIATLGCRTNQYESAAFATQLRALGYVEAGENENAEVCIVNTCTVTEGADRSSRHQIRQLVQNHPGAKVVVTGCLAERLPKQIAAIDGVHLVVGNPEKENLLQKLFPEAELPEFAIDTFPGYTRAFVKVQDGCNSFCTYCILPYVRGRSRSRKVGEILVEIEGLIAQGYKEIVLTGINIGDFDGNPEAGEKPVRLAELVRAVDQIPGLKRLRLSSIDPDEVDEELRNAIFQGKTTCPSMHIVLQSGSNAILKRMNRKYTRQMFLDSVQKLKETSDHFCFTTDVIVGFPGESEEDFAETLDVIKQVKFAKVHMFPYSPRERTRAALYPGQIPPALMQKRKSELLHLAEQVAYELRDSFIGKKLSVLLESEDEMPGYLGGHSENFLKVFVPADGHEPNEIVTVRCLENTPLGLIGEVCV